MWCTPVIPALVRLRREGLGLKPPELHNKTLFQKEGEKKNPASPSDLSYFNFPRDSLPSYILCSLLNSRNSSSASCLARLEVCATMLAPTSFVMFDFTTMFWEFRVRNYGKMNSYVILKFRECLLNLEKKSSVTCLKSV